jgi:esterase/lipase
MTQLKLFSSLLLAFLAIYIEAKETSLSTLENANFDAKYFESKSNDKYGVIVLGGSGGGKEDDIARKFSALGYSVLSLAYFDRSGSKYVPDTLELIPLEYFEEPKNWLMARTNTRNDGVIIYGLSKGAELALVLASYDDEYKAVIALAPSHVVWQGNPKNISNLMSSPFSWSRQGKGLPFVPYISNEAKETLGFSNRHRASLTNKSAVAKAMIQVEKIKHPTLLLTGGKDRSWPAFEMATQVCSKINIANPSTCSHISYANGDHVLSNYQSESFKEIEGFLNTIHK